MTETDLSHNDGDREVDEWSTYRQHLQLSTTIQVNMILFNILLYNISCFHVELPSCLPCLPCVACTHAFIDGHQVQYWRLVVLLIGIYL